VKSSGCFDILKGNQSFHFSSSHNYEAEVLMLQEQKRSTERPDVIDKQKLVAQKLLHLIMTHSAT
jgi:hypothetical protein